MRFIKKDYPHIIKYMGSKSKIMDFILDGINEVKTEEIFTVCDLFSGSASLAGALRGQTNVISNDIQSYSRILSEIYTFNINNEIDVETVLYEIKKQSIAHVNYLDNYLDFQFNYDIDITLEDFNMIEMQQQRLLNLEIFDELEFALFTKYYSGTYWSYKQCQWIDAIRKVADNYVKENIGIYNLIMASLMFALSYTSQSTGHFAQYRDSKTEDSMNNILVYRKRDIWEYFDKKFREIAQYMDNFNPYYLRSSTYNFDYLEVFKNLNDRVIIYADPPYASVHYSRFYHALETLVRYDYPDVKYKGRYRTDRHQSPFSIKTQVGIAFKNLFENVLSGEHSMVLSYSDTGMIDLYELINLAISTFLKYNLNDVESHAIKRVLDNNFPEINLMHLLFEGRNIDINYSLKIRFNSYLHSTMGNRDDKHKEVKEVLLIVKRLG